MIRASATGRLNYKDADSFDSRWLVRERLMLHDMERELKLALFKRKQLQQAATTVWPDVDGGQEVYQSHFNTSNGHLLTIGKTLFPYLVWDEKEYYKSELQRMREEYVSKFGDPSSPEAKARAKRDAESRKRQKLEREQQKKMEASEVKKREELLREIRLRRTNRRKR